MFYQDQEITSPSPLLYLADCLSARPTPRSFPSLGPSTLVDRPLGQFQPPMIDIPLPNDDGIFAPPLLPPARGGGGAVAAAAIWFWCQRYRGCS